MYQNTYRCLHLWSLFYGQKAENILIDAHEIINGNCRSRARTAFGRKPGNALYILRAATLSGCCQMAKEGDLISFSKSSHLKETLWHHWGLSFLWMNQKACLFLYFLLMYLESFFISLFTENWAVQDKINFT